MRVGLVLLAVAFTCSAALSVEARGRGGFFKGGRSFHSGPASQARSGPGMGVGVGIVVPVGNRSDRSSARPEQHVLPLPPRPAEEADAPKFHSASADPARAIASPAPKRAWCQDGDVVGRGSGFCQVTLVSGHRGAPALLTLSN